MSTIPPNSVQGTVPEFQDEMLFDPLQGAATEEQLAHIRSQDHTPSAEHAFDPPLDEMDYSKHTGQQAVDNNDLFDLPRMDSGLSTNSLGLRFDPDNNPLPFDNSAFNTQAEHLQSPIETVSRKSSGFTVSNASVLMSPTLTNEVSEPRSPSSGAHLNEPYKLLGGGDMMSRDSSLSTSNPSNQHNLKNTPAPTRSSAMTSPAPSSDKRLHSPVVRVVDSTHHDDLGQILHSPSGITIKRTHDQTRSHLHPEHANSGFDADSLFHTSDADEVHDVNTATRVGLAPGARDRDATVLSLNEETRRRKIGESNEQVASWLLTRDAGPGTYLDPNAVLGANRNRQRSKSTSKNSLQLQTDAFFSIKDRRDAQDRSTPGPDVLIDEDSGEEEEEGEDDAGSSLESAPASIDGKDEIEEQHAHETFGHFNLPEQPLQAAPWIDPIFLPSRAGQRAQPQTSNAAIMRWQMRNLDIDVETASRAATWGTRRMSDSTLDQVFGSKGLFSRLKITTSKDEDQDDGQETRSSLQEGIEHMKQKYRAFRSNSVNKRKSREPSREPPIRPVQRTDTYVRGVSPHSRRPESSDTELDRKESNGSFTNLIQRIPSSRRSTHSRPPTPRIDTGGASTPKPGSIGHGPHSPPIPTSPTSSHSGLKEKFKSLIGYKSDDIHGSRDSLTDMLLENGGPPVAVAALTSPRLEDSNQLGVNDAGSDNEDDDEDARTARPEGKTDSGVKMEMNPSKDLIIPNFDGFKSNVRDVNPRLEQWLVERLGQEQLRRYKRLVELKVQHIKAIQAGTCHSGDFCAAKGGQPRYFAPPKQRNSVSSGDADVPLDEMDEDEQAIAEGTVTEAQFPHGLPMPPAQRLPAEFECPFCFQVKKFTKPSDWSKHVHEDLQPFTCTFKKCSDPKSFKRKADWVRHENERHRQLEWWECTEEGCQHRCYRRDNFVQHLIREHKFPETNTKPAKQPNRPAVRGPAKSKGRGRGNTVKLSEVPLEEKVAVMVEVCRHETSKSAVEERCRFCGNVCNSWKKLTVHLARHMEQLSIPILELVKDREVNVDTIISPLEPQPPMQDSVSPVEHPSGSAFSSPDSYGTGAPSISIDGALMNPLVSLQDPSFTSGQFDPSWTAWGASSNAAPLQFPVNAATPFNDMSQAYSGATPPGYLPPRSGDAIFMTESSPPASLYAPTPLQGQHAGVVAGAVPYGQAQQGQFEQAAPQWQMQYGGSPQSHPMGYSRSRQSPNAQQAPHHRQQQEQAQQQRYYESHWQQ